MPTADLCRALLAAILFLLANLQLGRSPTMPKHDTCVILKVLESVFGACESQALLPDTPKFTLDNFKL